MLSLGHLTGSPWIVLRAFYKGLDPPAWNSDQRPELTEHHYPSSKHSIQKLLEEVCKILGTRAHLHLLVETKCDLEHAVIHVCSKPLISLSTLAHCPDLFHLTSKLNFRICLLFGCHGLESDASRLSTWNNGQLCGDPSCKLYGVAPEDATHFISTCTILETKCR